MKKIFLLLVLIIPMSAMAQAKFGLKGGLNLAKIHVSASSGGTSASVSSDNLTSFTAGLFLSSMINDKFGIQPELLYSGQGGSSSGGDLKLDYILLPIMLKFYAAESVTLQAGPQLGILMGASSGGQNIKDSMNSVDFDLNFGIGVELSGGTELGFRYVLGLANIVKDTGTGMSGVSITTTNQVMQFTVGFKLSK